MIRNILLLAASQGLLLTNGVTMVAVTGLAGLALEAPPAPTGKYRVVQVEELVSTLSVVEKSGCLRTIGRRRACPVGRRRLAVGAGDRAVLA